METLKKGNLAEAAVLQALVGIGADVLVPFGEGMAYDLAVDLDGGLVRVQCKAARQRKGCIQFNARCTDHGRGRIDYLGKAEIFGAYFAPTRSVFLVPVKEALGFQVNLRFRPAMNNQRQRIKLAEDYAVDQWSLDSLAEVLQTGHRRSRPGLQELSAAA